MQGHYLYTKLYIVICSSSVKLSTQALHLIHTNVYAFTQIHNRGADQPEATGMLRVTIPASVLYF